MGVARDLPAQVDALAALAAQAGIDRRVILPDAASVKVKAKIFSGLVSGFFKILAMRKVRISVLPVPGPATTKTGPSIVSTASFCSLFRALYRSSNPSSNLVLT